MPAYEIPTGPSPRTFSIALPSGTYSMRLAYADTDQGGWWLDIGDSAGNALVCGIPLVTGCDLLAAYGYLGFGGKLFVANDGDPGAVPTYADLGSTSHMYFEPD